MLKRKAQELESKRRKEIEFYTNRLLGKGEDKGKIEIRWVGIDKIENSIVSLGSLKVVN